MGGRYVVTCQLLSAYALTSFPSQFPLQGERTEAIRCLAHCVLSRSSFSCFHSNTNPKDSRQVHVLTLLPYPLFNIQQRTAILTPWSKRIFGTRTRRVVSWFAADVYLVPLWVVMALNLDKVHFVSTLTFHPATLSVPHVGLRLSPVDQQSPPLTFEARNTERDHSTRKTQLRSGT
jgi:hypothetical protein